MPDTRRGVQIRMFGAFELVVNGQQITLDQWKSKKALTLLKYLAARAGEKIPSDVLVDLLWPDADLESAGPSLHTAVYNARRVIEPERNRKGRESRIRSSNGLYWYSMQEPDALDVKEFDASVAASKAQRSIDPEASLTEALCALELYRGDFLSEFLYEDWTAALRETYREMYLETVAAAANILKEKKDHKGAVALLKAAISRDPFREELYQSAIENLIAADRYSEGMQLFKQCAEMLDEEFGLEPSEELRELVRKAKQPLSVLPKDLKAWVDGTANEVGAFICNAPMFESMVDVERRRLRRHKRPFSLLSVTTKDEKAGEEMLHALQKALRESDVICQWRDGQVMALLPNTDELGASVVTRRLKRTSILGDKAKAGVDFQVVSAENGDEALDLLNEFQV